MRKVLLSVMALACACFATAFGQNRPASLQPMSTAPVFSEAPPLALSALPGTARRNAEMQQWWQRTAPTTRDAVAGNYIQDSHGNAQSPTTVTFMGMMSITAGTATNEIKVNNFYGTGGSFTGTVNPSAGTVTFTGGQTVGTMDDGATTLKLYLADFNQLAYYNNDIVGTVSPAGIIYMPQMLIVASGQTSGQIRCYGDVWYKLNATQTDYSLWMEGENAVQSYPVHFSRPTTTQVLIKNFYGMGYPVKGTVDTVGKVSLPYAQVGVGTSSTGSQIVVRNYNVTAINYNTTPPTPTCNSSATPATFNADSIVTGPYCVAGSTTANRVDLVLKSVIKVQPSDAWQPITTGITWAGKGTREEPYLISSQADLLALSQATNLNAKLVKSNVVFGGCYFVQTADIDMDGVENFEPVSADASHGWGGIYDGQNHTISNLKINQTKGSTYRAALFGDVKAGGEVSNLRIVKPVISSANGYVATIAGQSYGTHRNIHITDARLTMDNTNSSYLGGVVGLLVNNGKVEDCSISGTIKGNNYVGGMVGNMNGSKVRRCVVSAELSTTPGNETAPNIGGIAANFTRDTSMVEDCVFVGAITLIGNENAGGIMGATSSGKGKVNRCWNGGQIMHRVTSTTTAHIGGIIGQGNGTQISDCLNTGVTQSYATPYVGGLAGNLLGAVTINGSLHLGTVMCSGDVRANEIAAAMADGVTVTSSYFDNQIAYNNGTGGLNTAALTSGQLPEGFNAEVWTLTAGKYPMLTRFQDQDRAALDRCPVNLAGAETVKGIKSAFTVGEETGVDWYFLHNLRYTKEGNGLKMTGNNVTVTATELCSDTIVALKGNYFRMIPVKVTPKEFDGDGTEASPYIIRNRADLERMFKAVDVDLFDYSDTYFRLEGDIDYTGVTNFTSYSATAPAYAFNGTLDGNGHHIKNLKISNTASGSVIAAWMMYTGADAVVKNLIVDESCSFTGGSNVAFVAANYGRLENIVNLASMTALNNNAAGIAALHYAGAAAVNCYNAGAITGGHRYAGGIVAEASKGSLIQGCQNSGNVKAVTTAYNTDATDLLYIGGIVGDGEGNVLDCLNQGSIAGYSYVGGVAGSFTGSDDNALMRCLNTGVVVEGERNTGRGGIAGTLYSVSDTTRFANNYYDNQFAYYCVAAASDYAGGAGVRTEELTSGRPVAGLNSELWQYAAGKYPVLKAFASQNASQWYASTYVKFASAPRVESRFDKRSDATLNLAEGTTASLAIGSVFSISAGKIVNPTSKDVATDTLMLASADGRYTLAAPLFATPRLLDNGDGTAANPWIINNANDWNILAQYSNLYQKGFDGEYFRVGADITFTSGFEPMCMGNTVTFNGIIDGNNKRIINARYDDEDQKYLGMIGYAGPRAKVYDLTMDSTCFFQGNQYVGAIAGHMEGEIYNVTNYATVTTTKMQYAGGIAGETTENGYIHNCTNHGVITSGNSGAGGIAGQQAGDYCRVEDCKNYGPISGKGSSGGIVGSSKGSLYRCTNYGAISTTSNAGGVLGYFWCVNMPTVADCHNYGTITNTGAASGGVIGYMQGTGIIRDCVNHADVTGGANYAGGILGTANTTSTFWQMRNVENFGDVRTNAYAGGIIGYAASSKSATEHSVVDSAVNHGNVSAVKTMYAGGIVAYAGNYVELRNVYNYGDTVFTTTYNCGGIAGYSTGSIHNAYNQAEVIGTTYNVGGICGVSNTSTVTDYGCAITNCVNVGNVSSLGATDANGYKVGGILGTGWVKVENCINLGDVKGRKAIAGIVGLACKGPNATKFGTQIYNTYNAGRVECTVDANVKTCGMIVGNSAGTAIANCKYENAVYDTQMAGTIPAGMGDAAYEGVSGMTTADLMKANFGDGFLVHENGYPMLKVFQGHDLSLMAAAAVMFAQGEHADNVVSSFRIAMPAGVSLSAENITFSSHGTAAWTSADLNNRTPITVSCGNHRRNIWLQFKSTTGVGQLDNDVDKPVREVLYFTPAGVRIAAPQQGINIRVTIFTDGTRRSERILLGSSAL